MSSQEPKPVPLLIARSSQTTEANKTGAWRFLKPRYNEKTAPCGVACPAGEDIGRIQMLTSQGLFKEAWETVLLENPFPGVCGRICYHPCETVCNRGHFDEAVGIHTVERFLAHTASRYELKPHLERLPSRKQKIAIGGAGPSGLAAAYFLARLGYPCDLYEAMPEPGGLLRWGVPSYRLAVDALRNEIERIQQLGVRVFCSKPFGDEFIERAEGSYDAVFLGSGAKRSRSLMVPGEDLPGVEDGNELLQKIAEGRAPALKGTIAVIGSGYAAIDAARCVVRLGASALLIYRRRREDRPAFRDEIKMALEEGVEIKYLETPLRIEADGEQYLLTLQTMEGADIAGDSGAGPQPGKVETIRVSGIFKAAGFEAAEPWIDSPGNGEELIRLNSTVLLRTDRGLPVVFGGDLVSPFKGVVQAIASGKEAAIVLDVLFRDGPEAVRQELDRCKVGGGRPLSMEVYMKGPRLERSPAVVRYNEINTDYFHFSPKIVLPRLLKGERIKSFAEIDLNISANLAIREAERCFNCGLCNQCDNCRLFCPDLAVIRDQTPMGRSIDYDYCKGCGICVVECPRNAMSLGEEQESSGS